jgi:hypothetical protein
MSNDLFDHAMRERLKSEAPLAARMNISGRNISWAKANFCGAPFKRINSFHPSFYGDLLARAKPRWHR